MFLSAVAALALSQADTYLTWNAPSGFGPAEVIAGGRTTLPNGRWLTPEGRLLTTGQRLWKSLLNQNGLTAIGISKNSIDIYDTINDRNPTLKKIERPGIAPVGVFSRDGRYLVVSSGELGGIEVFDRTDWSSVKKITANIYGARYSYISDIALSKDGAVAYTVDIANQRVVIFDVAGGGLVGSVAAGRQPISCALSPDESRLFVLNSGLYNYASIPIPDIPGYTNRGLTSPPFGLPSRDAERGRRMEGRSVSGLGTAATVDAQSVWLYDVKNPRKPKVVRKTKVGSQVGAVSDGQMVIGGSGSSKILVQGKRLFVSNAHNDTISVLGSTNLQLEKTIRLTAHPSLSKLRGVGPIGMCVNKDGTRLYVAESGLNSIAVVEPQSGTILGRVPTAWYPVDVQLSADEKSLCIATQHGSGRLSQESEPSGAIQLISLPINREKLSEMTQEVTQNNGLEAHRQRHDSVAGSPGRPSTKIKHVVLISSSSSTFDQIFGALKGVNGDAELARKRIAAAGADSRATDISVFPNHLKLATQFALSENAYCDALDPDSGVNWLMGYGDSVALERLLQSGWKWLKSDVSKGRLIGRDSGSSPTPEDTPESGAFWDHLSRNGISFRNYGAGFDFPGRDALPMTNLAGLYQQVNVPMPNSLFQNTCFRYPGPNAQFPDIARADWFAQDIEENYRRLGKPLPQFLNIFLFNNDTHATNPPNGYPFPGSYWADNDLALGRIVEYLSRQPEWKDMMIYVTVAGTSGGADHVSPYRGFVLAIGPHVKRGYVSRVHASSGSILKTISQHLGLAPQHLTDALASDLSEMLADEPDLTPFVHVPSDSRVFRPENTLDPTDPKLERRRSQRPQRFE